MADFTPPSGYTYCAAEGQSYTFNSNWIVDVAYGSNGVFNFKYNQSGTIAFTNANFGDPVYGVEKAGYYKIVADYTPPEGYTFCVNEYESYTFNNPVDLAFGANGSFVYKYNFTGTITFNVSSFGSDPANGIAKKGYYKTILPFIFSIDLPVNNNIYKDTLPLTGWALKGNTVINTVDIYKEGTFVTTLNCNVYRADVIAAYPLYSDLYCGFDSSHDISSWTDGNHSLLFRFNFSDETSNDVNLNITVTHSSRPSNWAWSYNITSGGNVYQTSVSNGTIIAYIIPASEWTSFQQRINLFRVYKGLSNYSFASISSQSSCNPAVINEAVNAINPMVANSISQVTSGNISASVFTNLRDKLNSIT